MIRRLVAEALDLTGTGLCLLARVIHPQHPMTAAVLLENER